MPKWRVRIRFITSDPRPARIHQRVQSAEIILDAIDEKDVRAQLAAMGVASEAVHPEMDSDVIDVRTESIDAVYESTIDGSWAKPSRSRSVRAVLAARKRIQQRRK